MRGSRGYDRGGVAATIAATIAATAAAAIAATAAADKKLSSGSASRELDKLK